MAVLLVALGTAPVCVGVVGALVFFAGVSFFFSSFFVSAGFFGDGASEQESLPHCD